MFARRTDWKLEPNCFARALEAHRASGMELFDLTASNPTTCGFVYPEREILEALADRRTLEYVPESKGMRSAREAVSGYYAQRIGHGGGRGGVDPERIILTAGTSEAYSYIFRLLCEVGDEILVPAPSYPLFEFLADLNDVRLARYPLFYDHGWHMDFAALRAGITPRTRAILLVNPNNPTGSFIRAEEAAQLGRLCAEREMAIVADEVFLDFTAKPAAQPTFALHDACLTFTLSGLSKISALPQMKLAWVAVNGPDMQAQAAVERIEIIADTYLSPGTPVQLALSKLLEVGRDMQLQLKSRIAANLVRLDSLLLAHKQVTRMVREGGWYAVLRAPATRADEDLAVAALEQCSVLVHPGQFFDFPNDGYLVISLIAKEREFEEGVRRLLAFLGTQS
jgi:aspartate/methionine/tyrosine aminotransferase